MCILIKILGALGSISHHVDIFRSEWAWVLNTAKSIEMCKRVQFDTSFTSLFDFSFFYCSQPLYFIASQIVQSRIISIIRKTCSSDVTRCRDSYCKRFGHSMVGQRTVYGLREGFKSIKFQMTSWNLFDVVSIKEATSA